MKGKKLFGKMKKNPEPSFKIISFFFVFFFIPQISLSEPLNLEQTINGLQKYLNSTIDFTALFSQITQLQSFDEKQTTGGEVYIMKPGKMRWEYKKPELQTIIINSGQVWVYTSEDNQVIKSKIENLGTSAIYELFLSREIKIKDIFKISGIKQKENSEKKVLFLELFPKSSEVNINKVIIEMSGNNYQINSFVTYDKLDNITTVKFIDIRRNRGIKSSVFDFDVPEGVEIITSEELGASENY